MSDHRMPTTGDVFRELAAWLACRVIGCRWRRAHPSYGLDHAKQCTRCGRVRGDY